MRPSIRTLLLLPLILIPVAVLGARQDVVCNTAGGIIELAGRCFTFGDFDTLEEAEEAQHRTLARELTYIHNLLATVRCEDCVSFLPACLRQEASEYGVEVTVFMNQSGGYSIEVCFLDGMAWIECSSCPTGAGGK